MLSKRDQDGIDSILDPIRKSRASEPMPVDKPSPIATPAFTIWKSDPLKPRVIIDLRRVNIRLLKNAYPLPR